MKQHSLMLIALISFLLTICFACNSDQSAVSGTIHMEAGWKNKVYLIQPRHFNEIASNYLGTVIDSAVIASGGRFSFSSISTLINEELVLLVVQREGERFANHLTDENPHEANYMPVVISTYSSINLTADISKFQSSFSIENPTAENVAMSSLRDIRLNAFDQLQEVLKDDTHDEEFIIEREAAHQQYTQSMRDFANSTSDYFAGLVAIRWVSPTGDFERNPEFIHSQCQKWQKEKPEHQFTAELCSIADKNQLPIMVGDIIPNFELPMVSGESTPLLQLLGSKLTILDIWASWCAPCRKENRLVLSPLFIANKDKGLNIIGYALDSGEGPWKAAIEKDSAVWDHASHLQGDQSPFMDALRITTIPANYILDAKGKILAKNLHGEELTAFISEQLK